MCSLRLHVHVVLVVASIISVLFLPPLVSCYLGSRLSCAAHDVPSPLPIWSLVVYHFCTPDGFQDYIILLHICFHCSVCMEVH
jgi:hypothetical protein